MSVEYRTAPIVEDGSITGAVVSFLDLSDRLAADEARLAAETATGALHELQQVLQPPPPQTTDPCLGIHYLPADAAAAGGDLYDWQELPNDGMHLVVVDVVGKGLVAARDALAVTHALRLLTLADTPLDQVVKQASWLLADAYPDLAATAIVARYDRARHRLRFVSAGHPPPLFISEHGTTRYLEASGRPLGWPDAGTDDVIDVKVPPGARVVFYTDGLIEARRDIVEGMQALADLALQVRDLEADAAARHLVVETLTAAVRRDDCLALVLDRPTGT
jgi:serine phosphatase RsbU (regulator of sigma subunit)